MFPAVDKLLTAYRDKVEPRMCGLPMYNMALRVEAVGFGLHEGRPCGVLVTPWCMNLIVLAGADDDWSGLTSGDSVKVSFPAGDYAFTLSVPEGIEAHLSLPLFTTVQDITDQDMACEIAGEVLRRLRQVDAKDEYADAVSVDSVSAGLDCAASRPPLSRRDLLRGRLTPADRQEI